jgi:hypothetical protein
MSTISSNKHMIFSTVFGNFVFFCFKVLCFSCVTSKHPLIIMSWFVRTSRFILWLDHHRGVPAWEECPCLIAETDAGSHYIWVVCCISTQHWTLPMSNDKLVISIIIIKSCLLYLLTNIWYSLLFLVTLSLFFKFLCYIQTCWFFFYILNFCSITIHKQL